MKVRIKFTKEGPMKFVGHLDTMRYFQKAIRRAELPIAFSGGYSPHMIMSFAAPLGVGVTSTGEYFDMELTATIPTDEICQRLNSQMVDGIHVLSARQVEDGKRAKRCPWWQQLIIWWNFVLEKHRQMDGRQELRNF